MRVLILDSYHSGDVDGCVVERTSNALSAAGHAVTRSVLHDSEFENPMTPDERRAYDIVGANLLHAATRRAAEEVHDVHGVVACFPVVTGTYPAPLENWLDRVLVPGVAFRFDDRGRVRPALHSIRRIGVVTTSTGDRRAGLDGRRTFTRTVRLQCGWWCRTTDVALVSGSPDLGTIDRRFGSWT